MSAPTPGPWSTVPPLCVRVNGPGEWAVCDVFGRSPDEIAANARLLAAAPALRDALRHVAAVLDAHGWGIVDERQVRAALAACEERDP